MTPRLIMKMKVAALSDVSSDVRLVTLRHSLGKLLPAQTGGAHVDFYLENGHVRQYSLCGDPDDRHSYTIAVKKQAEGRGGSLWVHEKLTEGMIVLVSAPRNNFPLPDDCDHVVLVAGGIGITPIVSMVHELRAAGRSFEVHYCARLSSDMPFRERLGSLCPDGTLHIYCDDQPEAPRFDAAALFAGLSPQAQVLCCGPAGFMAHMRDAGAGIPEERLHFEAFEAVKDATFTPAACQVVIASTGKSIEVPADRSLLDVLNEHGFCIASKCGEGICGTCEIGYRSGKVIHRDALLGPKARQSRMMPCVSRTLTTVVLDI